MDDLEALDRAGDAYRQRLNAVGDGQWTAPTRCGEWDVTALTAHITGGNQMAVALLDGADAQTAVATMADAVGTDPLTYFESTTAAQLAAFAANGALAMTVQHPALEMPGEMLLMFRTLDLAVHASDLAVSLGLEDMIDAELAESLWTRLEPIAPLIATSGMFGSPSGESPADATAAAKILHATGR
jgi:uncharacterized protein (TIGR03086 family)